MSTVGEMVNKAVSHQRWLDGHDGMNASAHTASREWGNCMRTVKKTLSSLGIWDAEVCEGEVHHGFDTDCAGFYPLDGGDDEGDSLAGLIDPSYGGKIVRFIVLPPREKEEG